MSAPIDKLKKKAAEFEQKKQFDKALEVYLQIIGQSEGQEDRDVTVYNRVGDLYLRLNKADQAVNYYEQAVDLYTEGGYLNNAIALCNKILRHAPARHQIYYKLGKISAKKGFNSDAKKNFLEYADRMHRAGKDTDAFKALQEFADLCPGQDDIRLMLADQLAKAGKKGEAIEQLQILHESLDAEGRGSEAEATVQRMQSLDPDVEPRRSKTPRPKEASGLVFLDVGGSPAKPRPKLEHVDKPVPETRQRPRTPPHVKPLPEFEQLPDIESLPDLEPLSDLEPLPDLDTLAEDEVVAADSNSRVPGLEIQSGAAITEIEPAFDLSLDEDVIPPLEGLESSADPDAFAIDPERDAVEPPLVAETVEGLIPADSDFHEPGLEPGLGEPLITEDPLSGLSILEDNRFYMHDTDPLAGLGERADEPSAAAEAEGEPEAAEFDSMELDEPEAQEEEEEEEVRPARKAAPRTPPRPEREKVARRTPPRAEPEQEDEEELEPADEHKVEKARAPEQLKQSKLKVVPVRPTRPKPRVEKEPEPAAPAQSEKRPLNPFQRQAPKSKPRDPSPIATPRLTTPPAEVPRAATPKQNAAHASHDDNLVDLADWLREDASPRSYRMVAEDDKRVGDEQADFTDMLEKFKAGVAANVDDEDFDSHYDLGIAYREMGLIDEAIAEFQKALRGATNRIRAYEALGQCFIDGQQYDVAISILGRALREPGMEDEDLIGVLYLLGYASEEGRKPRDAAAYYHRVFAIDMHFRDVSKRLKQMGKAASK
jgi:tetratricopeptide (TPR) repeat protein